MPVFTRLEFISAQLLLWIDQTEFTGIDEAIGGIGRATVFSAQRTVAMDDVFDRTAKLNLDGAAQAGTLVHVFFGLIKNK